MRVQLKARLSGRGNVIGELSMLLTLAGFVLLVVGHGDEDVGGLGLFLILLSMIPRRIAAIIAQALPLWSALLLPLAAPLATGFFGRRHVFLGPSPQALGVGPSWGVGLIFASLLLVGCGLLLSPLNAQQRPVLQ